MRVSTVVRLAVRFHNVELLRYRLAYTVTPRLLTWSRKRPPPCVISYDAANPVESAPHWASVLQCCAVQTVFHRLTKFSCSSHPVCQPEQN